MAQTPFFASLNACNSKFVPHTAARCYCNKQQHKTPRAQQYTSLLVPCAHGKLNAKHYRATPKPETHMTRQVVEKRSCAGEKIENRAPKKRIQAAEPPPPATHSKQHNCWVELVRVCRLAVVAAAAACCSYCDIVTTRTRPCQTRHGLSEGRGVAQFLPS